MVKVAVALAAVVIALAVVAVTVLTLVIALEVDFCLPSPPDEDHRLSLGGEGLYEDICRRHHCQHRANANALRSLLLPQQGSWGRTGKTTTGEDALLPPDGATCCPPISVHRTMTRRHPPA